MQYRADLFFCENFDLVVGDRRWSNERSDILRHYAPRRRMAKRSMQNAVDVAHRTRRKRTAVSAA
jgi:hypothetical protein